MSFDPTHFTLLRNDSQGVRIATVWYDISTRHPHYDLLTSERGFLAALRRAVTKWVKETSNGDMLWGSLCKEMNIADLAHQYSEGKIGDEPGQDPDDRALWEYLKDEGIFHLTVDVVGDDEATKIWNYTDCLVEEEEA